MVKDAKYRSAMLPLMRFSMEEMIAIIARLDADADALDAIDYAQGIVDQVDSLMAETPEYTPDEELAAAYQSGMSLLDVAARFNVAVTRVSMALRRLGVKSRPRGSGHAAFRKNGADPERTSEMIALHNKGHTLEEISTQYKITCERVRQILVKAGINTSERPLKEEQLAVVQEYLAGESLISVAEAHNITLSTLKNWVRMAGYEVRPSPRTHAKETLLKAQMAADLYRSGMKVADIAGRLGFSGRGGRGHGGAIYRLLAIAGVKLDRQAVRTPRPIHVTPKNLDNSYKKWSEADIERLRGLHAKNYTNNIIAEVMGRTSNAIAGAVWRYCRENDSAS